MISNKMVQFIIGAIILMILISIPTALNEDIQKFDISSEEVTCKTLGFENYNKLVYCADDETGVEIPENFKYQCGQDSDDYQNFQEVYENLKQNYEDYLPVDSVCESGDKNCDNCILQAFRYQRQESLELLGIVDGGTSSVTIGDVLGGEVEQDVSTLEGIINFVDSYTQKRESEGIKPASRTYNVVDLSGTEFQSTYENLDKSGLLPYLEKVAEDYDLDPSLLFFIIHKESNGRPNLISSTGCAGLTQFCYDSAEAFFPRIKDVDPSSLKFYYQKECRGSGGVFSQSKCPNKGDDSRYNPYYSIEAMAIHYKDNLRVADGNSYVAIAGYNAGTGNFKSCNSKSGYQSTVDCICSIKFGANGKPLTNGNQGCDYVTKIGKWVDTYSIFSEKIDGEEGSYTSTNSIFSNLGLEQPKLAVSTRSNTLSNPSYSSYLVYSNGGATRNKGLAPDLEKILAISAQEVGVQVRVISGGQVGIGTSGGRTGSTRHDFGNAADIDLYEGNKRLTINDVKYLQFVELAFRNGVRAGSMGSGYMGSGRSHLDITDGCSFWGWKGSIPYATFVQSAKKGIAQRGGNVVDCSSCGSSCNSFVS